MPWQVKIFEHTVNLDILEEILHDSITVYGDSFLTDVFTVSNVKIFEKDAPCENAFLKFIYLTKCSRMHK